MCVIIIINYCQPSSGLFGVHRRTRKHSCSMLNTRYLFNYNQCECSARLMPILTTISTCIYFQTRIPLHRLFSNYLITIDECMARVMPVLSNIFTYIYIQSRIPIAAIIYRAQATYCEHPVICHVPLSPRTCPSLVFNFVLSLSLCLCFICLLCHC